MENNTIASAQAAAAQPKGSRKTIKRYIWLVIIIVVALVVALLWWLNYRKYITTDDANLDSYRVNVAAKVMASVVAIHAWEGDTVRQGMLLVELNSGNVQAELQQSLAQRDEIAARLVVDRQNLETAKANRELAKVSLNYATDNYNRAKMQYEGKTVTQEYYQAQEEAYQTAKVKLSLAGNQVDIAKVQISATQASLATAQAAIVSVQTTLGYYKIYAPHDGVIAKRYFLPGDMVKPGQTIYTINQESPIWVAVYLEETKFKNIVLNQPVDFTLDAYPHLKFKGTIFYIGSNAASEFALIPPNNASGNYTKVTQRIPLKVSIDEVYDKHGKAAKPVLVSGMSVNIKIVKENLW